MCLILPLCFLLQSVMFTAWSSGLWDMHMVVSIKASSLTKLVKPPATLISMLQVIGFCYFTFYACCFYFRFADEIFFPLTVLLKRTVAFTEWLEDEMKCLHRRPLQSACWSPNSASFVCELESLAHKDEQMTPYKAVLVTYSGMCANIDL